LFDKIQRAYRGGVAGLGELVDSRPTKPRFCQMKSSIAASCATQNSRNWSTLG